MQSLTNFKIDQAATFVGLGFLSCEPKTEFGSQDKQEVNKDGVPKWEVQAVAMTRDVHGKPQSAVLKVGVASYKNPAEGMAPYTPINFVNFEIGVMDKTKRMPSGEEKILGALVWYRADAIKTLAPAK